jgi:hypothetical protein
MANKRELKKDIDYLVFEVIADCFAYKEVAPDNNIDEIAEIINDAVGLRNDLIARVNNPEGKDNRRITKTYFQQVSKDLLEGVDKLFSRLSALAAAK